MCYGGGAIDCHTVDRAEGVQSESTVDCDTNELQSVVLATLESERKGVKTV